MEANLPLVSIIVPVYNVEKYLPQCLDSLINQTYKNIEIICVNDGSIDTCSKILDEYASFDSRIKIVNKKNEGVSSARNNAITISCGEYFLFVDADDSTDIHTCETAVTQADKLQCDVVMWGYISESSARSDKRAVFDKTVLFEYDDVKRRILRRLFGLINDELAHPETADSLCPVWAKLYAASIIRENKIKFIDLKEIGTYEDGLFNIEVFEHVKKALFIDEFLYHYRRDNIDSQTTCYRDDLYEKWLHLFDLMELQIKRKGFENEFYSALQNRIALSILGLGLNIISANRSDVKKRSALKDIVSSKRYQQAYQKLTFNYFPVHWKLFYFCAKHQLIVGLYYLLLVINKIIT